MFKITNGKGFHLTFENGYTASVQWGGGNYCDNNDLPFNQWDGAGARGSHTAEIAYYRVGDKGLRDMDGDTVAGYKSPAEVLAFLNMVASLPKA